MNKTEQEMQTEAAVVGTLAAVVVVGPLLEVVCLKRLSLLPLLRNALL
jgi:hypothetical protein